jgi:lysozyme family protein
MTVTVAELKVLNRDRWRRASITPDCKTEVMLVARRLVSNKARYQAVERTTGVPWFLIACLHEREASGSFKAQLGQGDPLNHVSTHEPKGRGPFSTWEDGAYDALVRCAPFASRNKDWTVGGTLTLAEEYNGLGPETYHHIPSGYVWGATNIEERGKYIADGKWSGSTWDTQIGVAALILGMKALDASIAFAGEASAPEVPVAPTPKVPPQPEAHPSSPAGSSGSPKAAPEAPANIRVSIGNVLSGIVRALSRK